MLTASIVLERKDMYEVSRLEKLKYKYICDSNAAVTEQ